jgi:hypothetical protein
MFMDGLPVAGVPQQVLACLTPVDEMSLGVVVNYNSDICPQSQHATNCINAGMNCICLDQAAGIATPPRAASRSGDLFHAGIITEIVVRILTNYFHPPRMALIHRQEEISIERHHKKKCVKIN